MEKKSINEMLIPVVSDLLQSVRGTPATLDAVVEVDGKKYEVSLQVESAGTWAGRVQEQWMAISRQSKL